MGQLRSRKTEGQIVAKLNTTGTTIGSKLFVKLSSGADLVALPGADADPLFGVTLEPIPNNTWGAVQIGPSLAICTAAGALATPGALLMSDTAGKVKAWAAAGGANTSVAGVVNTTASGADVELEVELAPPFAVKQG